MHHPATAEQRTFSDSDIALSMFICVIECGLFLMKASLCRVFFIVCLYLYWRSNYQNGVLESNYTVRLCHRKRGCDRALHQSRA